jgi:hypothetical protein
MISNIWYSLPTQMTWSEGASKHMMLRDRYIGEKVVFSCSTSTNKQEINNIQSFIKGKTINDNTEQL